MVSYILFPLFTQDFQFIEGDTEAQRFSSSSHDVHPLNGRARTQTHISRSPILCISYYPPILKSIRKLCGGQQELSVLTSLMVPTSLTGPPSISSPTSLSWNMLLVSLMHQVPCNMLGNQRFFKSSPFSGRETNPCVGMRWVSQSYLEKRQAATIWPKWEGEIMPWSLIQLGMWVHTHYSGKRSEWLKVRRTCFDIVSLRMGNCFILTVSRPFKMCHSVSDLCSITCVYLLLTKFRSMLSY